MWLNYIRYAFELLEFLEPRLVKDTLIERRTLLESDATLEC